MSKEAYDTAFDAAVEVAKGSHMLRTMARELSKHYNGEGPALTALVAAFAHGYVCGAGGRKQLGPLDDITNARIDAVFKGKL